ncbi:MAG: hypothetical protein ACW97Z_13800 [Candidatus Hodarchaeales archaeon]|jgi:glycine hydroxymethyltransferase
MTSTNNDDRMRLFSAQLQNHQQLRDSYLNLVASENVLSPLVRNALSNDLAGRYSSEFYGGSNFTRKIIDDVEEYAKELFNCEYANVTPISGNICDLAALNSLTSINDKISMISMERGGYPFEIKAFNRNLIHLPFDKDEWNLDYRTLRNHLEKEKPKLIIVGASAITSPYKISEILDHVDLDSQYVVYDGSHVLGLIAGKRFQDPLREGVQLLFGSTHKTFPGPQGGLVLGNDLDILGKVCSQFSIQTSEHPFGKDHRTILVDNVHANRIAALGFAILEMLEFGEAYADQIIKNSIALGQALKQRGFDIFESLTNGITQSHQIIFFKESEEGSTIKAELEEVGIFVDAFIRIGTSEVTRRGMKQKEMETIADLIYERLNTDRSTKSLKAEVKEFCAEFQDLSFCFN